MNPTPKESVKALVWQIGLDNETIAYVESTFATSCFKLPATPEQIANLRMDPPEIVLVGEAIPPQVKTEIIQSIWLKSKTAPVIQVVREARRFDRMAALSIGVKEIFLLPYEKVFFEEYLIRHLGLQETTQKRLFEAVRLIDIDPHRELTFDLNIFLKTNRKFICMVRKGQKVGPTRMTELKNKVPNGYVDEQEMTNFKEFVRENLKLRKSLQDTSSTENKTLLKNHIRSLVCALFSPQKAAANLEIEKRLTDVKNQIRTIISQTTFETWSDRLTEVYGDQFDIAYNHACNTALYAAFFSMGTNIGIPEEMAVAGVLHDLGLALIGNPSIIEIDVAAMTPPQKSTYNLHVQKMVNEILARKLNVGRLVPVLIQQHHELFCGKGFPAGIGGAKILPESQILSLADRMDELTSYTEFRGALTPRAAMQKIVLEDQTKDAAFSPQILTAMDELFNETFGKKAS